MPAVPFHLLLALLTFVCLTGNAAAWTVGFLTGSGGLGDESFNDMTYKGLGQAKQELGIEIVVCEWEPEHSMEKLFLELVRRDSKLIVLNGDQFNPLLQKYAETFHTINFIANDFIATSKDGSEFSNVKSIAYSQHEGAFLAGILAAEIFGMQHIGFLGAIEMDIIKAYYTGFVEGVKFSAPSARIAQRYISRHPDYSGFNNPHAGFDVASSMYRDGIDVIFAVAGASGNGIIHAAKKHNRYMIGVDSNQDHMAKGAVLTSVMKRLDIAVYNETINAFNGRFQPGTAWYGLANGGISLTPMKFTRHLIPNKTRKKLQHITEKIISGKITVTNSLVE